MQLIINMVEAVDRILLGHGSGGRLMHQLIREYFVPEFDMKSLGDSAVVDISECGMWNADNTPQPPLKLRGGWGAL